MSLGADYLSVKPTPFPRNDSSSADLIAPFWADADSSGVKCDCTSGCATCGADVVYYQVYENDPTVGVTAGSTTQKMLDLATADGQKSVPGFVTANWVMVVTWSQSIPYPYSSNQNSFEVRKPS